MTGQTYSHYHIAERLGGIRHAPGICVQHYSFCQENQHEP